MEDEWLDMYMEDRVSGNVDTLWDDDLYWVNQREADDYRHELDGMEDEWYDGSDDLQDADL